jgi:hypothetical protein
MTPIPGTRHLGHAGDEVQDRPAEEERQPGAEHRADPHRGGGEGDLFARPIVGRDRPARRAIAGFARADPHATRQQADEALREAARDRACAPHCQRGGDQIAAIAPVGQPRDRHADDTVGQGKGRADEQSRLRIADVEILLDRPYRSAARARCDRAP